MVVQGYVISFWNKTAHKEECDDYEGEQHIISRANKPGLSSALTAIRPTSHQRWEEPLVGIHWELEARVEGSR